MKPLINSLELCLFSNVNVRVSGRCGLGRVVVAVVVSVVMMILQNFAMADFHYDPCYRGP